MSVPRPQPPSPGDRVSTDPKQIAGIIYKRLLRLNQTPDKIRIAEEAVDDIVAAARLVQNVNTWNPAGLSHRMQRFRHQLADRIRSRAALLANNFYSACGDVGVRPTVRKPPDRALLEQTLAGLVAEGKSIELRNDRFYVWPTAEMVVQHPSSRVGPVALGQFKLTWDFVSLYKPSALPFANNVSKNGYYHPHIYPDGDFICLGDTGSDFWSAVALGDYATAFDFIEAVLGNYNKSSPYQRLDAWVSFPTCQICGRSSYAPLEASCCKKVGCEACTLTCGCCKKVAVCKFHWRRCYSCDRCVCHDCRGSNEYCEGCQPKPKPVVETPQPAMQASLAAEVDRVFGEEQNGSSWTTAETTANRDRDPVYRWEAYGTMAQAPPIVPPLDPIIVQHLESPDDEDNEDFEDDLEEDDDYYNPWEPDDTSEEGA